MPLVDYSSSTSENEDYASDSGHHPPPSKRVKTDVRKASHQGDSQSPQTANVNRSNGSSKIAAQESPPSSMPPLPSTFHDLYASTVRQSVVDDPTLHQGRKRQIPHVAGRWPSHLYIEWHPTLSQHDLLTALIKDIEALVSNEVKLHNFLTSDLGTPLPLHISLSRPLSLTTSNKDEFLNAITKSLASSGIGPFNVHPHDLAWFRSPDSNRTFLVLRVETDSHKPKASEGQLLPQLNPELVTLLSRSNSVASRFEQPILYQKDTDELAGSAFHISIGWTFDLPSDELSIRTLRLFKKAKFDEIRAWNIEVNGIKAKIGNTINHISLETSRKGAQSAASSTYLFAS